MQLVSGQHKPELEAGAFVEPLARRCRLSQQMRERFHVCQGSEHVWVSDGQVMESEGESNVYKTFDLIKSP